MALTFAPSWFYGYDAIFDIISLLVCLLVFYFSYRVFKVLGNKNYRIVSYSFVMIAASFVIKLISNMVFYNSLVRDVVTGVIQGVARERVVYVSGVFFYQFFFLASLCLLFWLTLKVKDKRVLLLLVFFSGVSTLLNPFLFSVFHIAATVILFFVFTFFHHNYSQNATPNTFQVMTAFLLIFLSQLSFVFISLTQIAYVLGEFLQLFGYSLLLINCVSILKK